MATQQSTTNADKKHLTDTITTGWIIVRKPETITSEQLARRAEAGVVGELVSIRSNDGSDICVHHSNAKTVRLEDAQTGAMLSGLDGFGRRIVEYIRVAEGWQLTAYYDTVLADFTSALRWATDLLVQEALVQKLGKDDLLAFSDTVPNTFFVPPSEGL